MVERLMHDSPLHARQHFAEPLDVEQPGGSIGASVSAINQTIPGVMTDLDTLAGTLVRETNKIHNQGTVYTGTPPAAAAAGNFFNQDALIVGPTDPYQTARGMSVSATLNDVANVAAAGGVDAAGVLNNTAAAGPGNNSIASALAALRDTPLTFQTGTSTSMNGSLGAFYRYTVSSVALASSQSSSQATVQGTLASQADTRRQSVSGVSTDEELVNMIKQQQAYQAAAKLINVVDQMAQTLINLGQ